MQQALQTLMQGAPPAVPASGHAPAQYEASLYGSITGSKLFEAVYDRLTLQTETPGVQFHWREVVFDLVRTSSVPQYEEPNQLICRRDLMKPEPVWLVYSHAKPEPARLYPDAMVRPAVYSQITGSALSLASTLGYTVKSETFKRGFIFTRGVVNICLYQHDKVNPQTSALEKADEEAVWIIEARTPPTPTNLNTPIASLLEVRTLMKGLVDLERFIV